ncbi:MAG: hypothetical protein BWY19_00059 [bacterium ADurb.Bin212]|nr:MAG: hypothetical protein BWY19_00059 [bacterium ADurb.Bin212]
MPRYDGTGPMGTGPMTGRGMGPCGGGASWGRGFGRGRGLGMGYGERFAGRCYLTAREELDSLKEEAVVMEADLKALKEQISEMEAK